MHKIYIHAYIRICIYIYICIHVHIYIYTYGQKAPPLFRPIPHSHLSSPSIPTHTSMHACVCVHIHTCAHEHSHSYTIKCPKKTGFFLRYVSNPNSLEIFEEMSDGSRMSCFNSMNLVYFDQGLHISYVHIYTCIYTHIYIYTSIHIYTYIFHVFVYIYIYIYMYVYIHIYI